MTRRAKSVLRPKLKPWQKMRLVANSRISLCRCSSLWTFLRTVYSEGEGHFCLVMTFFFGWICHPTALSAYPSTYRSSNAPLLITDDGVPPRAARSQWQIEGICWPHSSSSHREKSLHFGDWTFQTLTFCVKKICTSSQLWSVKHAFSRVRFPSFFCYF